MTEENTIIEVDFDSMVEPKVLEDGEYLLEVANAESKTSKSGNAYINVRLTCPDVTEAEDIFYIVMLPTGKDPKADNRTKWNLKQFFDACGLPLSNQFDPADFIGAQFWALVEKEYDEQYGERNRISKVIRSA